MITESDTRIYQVPTGDAFFKRCFMNIKSKLEWKKYSVKNYSTFSNFDAGRLVDKSSRDAFMNLIKLSLFTPIILIRNKHA